MALAFGFGLLFWVIDAGIDLLWYYERSFQQLLLTNIPSHEIYIRLVILVLFLIFGWVFSRTITRERRLNRKFRRIYRAQHLLSTVNQYLVRVDDEQKLLDEICRILIDEGNYKLAWVGYVRRNESETIEPVASRGATGYLKELNFSGYEAEDHAALPVKTIRTGTVQREQNINRYENEVGRQKSGAEWGMGSMVSFPLTVEGEVIGTLSIYASIPGHFDDEEVRLLQELADDVAYGIYTLRIYDKYQRGVQQLEKSEQQYRTLIQNIPDADVFLFDTEPRIISAEGDEMKRLGFDSSHWVGYTLDERLDVDMLRIIKPLYKEALAGRRAQKEILLGENYYQIQTVPIINNEGEVTGGLAFNQNITRWKLTEQALVENEEKFRTIFNNANDAMYLHGITKDGIPGTFEEVNDIACSILGYSREELIQMTPVDISAEDSAMRMMEQLEQHSSLTFESEFRANDGTLIPVEISSHLFNMGGKKRVLSIARDIRERKKMEAEVTHEQELLHKLMNNIPDLIYFKNRESEFTRINKAQADFLGAGSPEEAIGKSDFDYFSRDFAQKTFEEEQTILKTGESIINNVEKVSWGDDEDIWLSTTKVPFWDDDGKITGLVGVTRDLTRRKKAEEELQEALREKETLLRELYHRTKNNMQVIQSMLQLQMMDEEDEHILEVFTETSNRIRTMALVHQRLYESKNLSSIDMSRFLSDLADLILGSYTEMGVNVEVFKNLDSIDLTIDSAVPVGLVFNELLTNTMKHAFPQKRGGNVTIELHKKSDKIYLTIEDDGVGFPDDFEPREAQSMGLSTIFSIVELQLQGEVHFKSNNGVTCSVSIQDQLYSERV